MKVINSLKKINARNKYLLALLKFIQKDFDVDQIQINDFHPIIVSKIFELRP